MDINRKGTDLSIFLSLYHAVRKIKKRCNRCWMNLPNAIYFDEDVNDLFIEVDVTKTAADVELLDLPNTPCLICYGEDPVTANTFSVFIDEIVSV